MWFFRPLLGGSEEQAMIQNTFKYNITLLFHFEIVPGLFISYLETSRVYFMI